MGATAIGTAGIKIGQKVPPVYLLPANPIFDPYKMRHVPAVR